MLMTVGRVARVKVKVEVEVELQVEFKSPSTADLYTTDTDHESTRTYIR